MSRSWDKSEMMSELTEDMIPVSFRGSAPIIALLFVVVLVVFSLFEFNTRHEYEQAEQLVLEGQYTEALEIFSEDRNSHFRDNEAYIAYCDARLSFARGELAEAEESLEKVALTHAPKENLADVEAFRAELNKALADAGLTP